MSQSSAFAFQAGALASIAMLGLSVGAAWLVGTLRKKGQTVSAVENRSSGFAIEGQGAAGLDDTMEQLDLLEALEARDEILAEVAENNSAWVAKAMAAFAALPLGSYTGEDIRLRLTEAGLEAPRNAYVWGAFIGKLAKAGMLVATGEMRPMRTRSSNARRTAVWRELANEEIAA